MRGATAGGDWERGRRNASHKNGGCRAVDGRGQVTRPEWRAWCCCRVRTAQAEKKRHSVQAGWMCAVVLLCLAGGVASDVMHERGLGLGALMLVHMGLGWAGYCTAAHKPEARSRAPTHPP